jgi:hypothetical protein
MCPSCRTAYEGQPRFCGTCGYRLASGPRANTACPSCRTAYEGQPRFCGTCGYQFASGPMANTAPRKRLTPMQAGCGCLTALAIIGALAISNVSRSPLTAPVPTSPPLHNGDMAYIMAQTFIKGHLKAPGSAEFASRVWNEDEVRVVELPNGSYRVSAWVDAQNSFGAKLRNNWTCELKQTTETRWVVTGFCGLLPR